MIILTSLLFKLFFKQLTLRSAAYVAAHIVMLVFVFENLIFIDI